MAIAPDPPSRPEDASRPERWAIVGGGMLGLTLAQQLVARGHRVTLLEAAPELGGLASAWNLGDVVWDRHYHVTLQSDTALRSLLRELDLDGEIQWTTTRSGYFVDGRLHSISNPVELLRFPALGLLGKLRFGGSIFWASRVRDWQRLERIPVADWLRRLAGRQATERMWLPLLRSKLGEAYRDTSAAFIWATVQRLYAARRSGLKTETFGFVPGGYGRVLERLARLLEKQGVALRTGVRVASVGPAGGKGVRVELEGDEAEVFDHVVVTAAAPLAARICPGLSEAEQARLRPVRYLGIVCASLLLERPLSDFYVTNLLDPGLPFTGVIEMSALTGTAPFGGRSLVYLPRYLESDDRFFETPDDEVRRLFLAGLRRLHPSLGDEDVAAFRISRVRNVMPLPTLGYSERVQGFDTSVPGLHLVNSAQIVNGTLNVNETIGLALRAARHFEPSASRKGGC